VTDIALQTSDLSVAFGTLKVLKVVSLAFRAQGRYAIIGPNGAGKTTFLNAMSGRQTPTSGTVQLFGRDITHMRAHLRARAGLGRSFQIVSVFPELSVRDNLLLAAQAARFGSSQPWWRPLRRYRDLYAVAHEVLDSLGLSHQADHSAASQSHGDRRMLELGLALVAKPPVLLLDEPLAGIGHERIDSTMDLIMRMSAGRTVVLVEHNMDAVMRFAQQVIVLAEGSVLAQGSPEEVRANTLVRTAYLGGE